MQPTITRVGGNTKNKNMFEINIQTKVSLSSGAVIDLTEEQTKRIKDYTLAVLFGEATVSTQKKDEPVRRKKKSFKKHVWTKEQKDIVLREVYLAYPPHNPANIEPRRRKIKELMRGPLYGHTYRHIFSMNNYLGQLHRAKELKEAQGWSPVVISTTRS